MLTNPTNSSFPELSLSYNGGKDCLVLLILFLATLHTHTTPPPPPLLQSVYIVSPHPFPEVESFVAASSRAYHLDLARYAKPMKAAFAEYLREKPAVKAIFVGTRRTDPHGDELTFFDHTDRGWPAFMRVHPVIDWHYAEIWSVSCFRFSSFLVFLCGEATRGWVVVKESQELMMVRFWWRSSSSGIWAFRIASSTIVGIRRWEV